MVVPRFVSLPTSNPRVGILNIISRWPLPPHVLLVLFTTVFSQPAAGSRHDYDASLSAKELGEQPGLRRLGIGEDTFIAIPANFSSGAITSPGKAHADLHLAQIYDLEVFRQLRGESLYLG